MKQYKVIIEETVSQAFEVEAATPEEALRLAEQAYKSGRFVLEPGALTDVRVSLCPEELPG